MSDLLLEVDGVSTGYGDIQALWRVGLSMTEGGVVGVLGRNGAGKTTLLSAISGLRPLSEGRIVYQGRDISRTKPYERVKLGISLVQEGKRIFHKRTVEENLKIAAYAVSSRRVGAIIGEQYERFEILRERRKARAATLSGGEQQMLAIAQALIPQPKLLMLDEPTAGLAPSVIKRVFESVLALKAEGISILLVEQVVHEVMAIADQVCVLELGRVVERSSSQLISDAALIEDVYFGARRQ